MRTDDIYRLDISDGTGAIKGVAGADGEDWKTPEVNDVTKDVTKRKQLFFFCPWEN